MRKYLVMGMIAAMAIGVYAQPSIQEGTRELFLEGSWDSKGATGSEMDLTVGYGVFMRDQVEVGGFLEYSSVEDAGGIGSGVDATLMGLGGLLEYHFDMASMSVPYVGFRVAYLSVEQGSFDDSAITYGPRIGLKYFIADNVAIDIALNYTLSTEDIYVNEGVVEDKDMSLQLGIRAMF